MKLKAKIFGGQKPHGTVRVSGAKNAATRLLAAALLSDETVILDNFPTELVDANHKMDFIRNSGGNVIVDKVKEFVEIDPRDYKCTDLDSYNYPIRTTYLLTASLIKKSKIAKIPYPGGCKIGNRGYDLHIMVWETLGALVEEKPDFIQISVENGFQAGKTIDFPISTVGGTENALLCASIIDGETIIKNAYISPEVASLIDFLRTMGSEIEVVGNSYIKVIGKSYLRGSKFTVIPDRIEALTWIIYGVLSGGNITVEDVPFDIMRIPLLHLQDAGIDLYQNSRNVYVSPECLTNGIIQPFELATGTHPGIISDMQPFYVLLALHANGTSRVFDYRYPERIKFCDELLKFYPNMIEASNGTIKINGNNGLIPQNAEADSTDLRGSMAVLMAALLADGTSTVENVHMALRGYNNLDKKLEKLGVKIEIF